MATTEDLRLKILDRPQLVIAERVGTGDGSSKVYKFLHSTIMATSVSVYVAGVKKTETTDYTLDYASGKLTLVVAPSDGDSVVADYEFATFSDTDLQAFLDGASGNLALAAGEILTSLLADSGRLITWSRGDMKIDYDRLRQDIADVARRFLSQGASESGGATVNEVDWEEVI